MVLIFVDEVINAEVEEVTSKTCNGMPVAGSTRVREMSHLNMRLHSSSKRHNFRLPKRVVPSKAMRKKRMVRTCSGLRKSCRLRIKVTLRRTKKRCRLLQEHRLQVLRANRMLPKASVLLLNHHPKLPQLLRTPKSRKNLMLHRQGQVLKTVLIGREVLQTDQYLPHHHRLDGKISGSLLQNLHKNLRLHQRKE